jgi:arylsulfatase A-like enzyme
MARSVHIAVRRALVFSTLLTLCVVPSQLTHTQAPPNILLIVSDDHGWGDHGFMGHPTVRTPSIDRLAATGRLHTRGYVPTALCRPSLATLLTGRYPHQHGMTGNDPPGGAKTMADPAARATMVDVFRRNKVLPALLADRGYISLQTGKWWEGRPLDFGFTAAMTHGDVARRGRHGDEGLGIGREGLQPIYDFIDSAGGKPFLVWYAPFLPHTPHTPPERLLKKYAGSGLAAPVARYYAMIEWLDETVGQLLDHLDRKNLSDNTIVVYVADNGWIQSPDSKPSQPTRAKMSPYDAGIRTPIVIRWPARVVPARDDKTLAGSIDILPTLLKAAGITAPSNLPGIDLLDARALARRQALFGSLFVHTAVDVTRPVANLKYRYAVREDGWKLILPFIPNRDRALMIDARTADWMRFEPELYHLLTDPHEERNRAAERSDIVKQLRAAIDAWWRVPE